jgi:aldose sugar dehydrogenase
MNPIKPILSVIVSLAFISVNAQYKVTLDSTVLTVDTVIGGLDVPWEIVWGPDDHIWFTERHGKISRVNPENGERKILLDYRDKVYQNSESGMLGLFLHPEFSSKPFVYVAYTYLDNSNIKERISRFSYANDTLTNEDILIDGIKGNRTHNGCRFLLLPDNTLLLSTGDARRDADAQNPSLLNGKMLRMTLDGEIPSDNPNALSYIWSWGHRNAQGLALGPDNQIYSSEHGPDTDDEVNILVKGRNFGWPTVEGICNTANEMTFCSDSNVVEPIFSWTPTIAPSDLIYFDHPAIPEFRKALVMTVLKDKEVVVLHLNDDGSKVDKTNIYFKQEFNRLRDIITDGNGVLYLATNGVSWGNSDPNTHVILRLRNEKFIGVDDLKKSSTTLFKIYPNPSSRTISIERTNASEQANVYIVDHLGREVDQFIMNENHIQYSNTQIPPGIYFIRMDSEYVSQQVSWIKIAN